MVFDPRGNPETPPRPKQLQCFTALDANQSVLANLWTGYGKTWVALYLAQKAVSDHKQFLITCPLRALVDQLTEECTPYFRTVPVSGDYRHHKALLFEPDYHGFCMTYEMAYTKLINQSQRRLLFEDIKAVIIDEIQIMSDLGRGAVVEASILLLQYLYPQIQLLLMSATLGNAEAFANHFGLSLVKTEESERPVPLEKEILDLPPGKSKEKIFSGIYHALTAIIDQYPHTSKMPAMLVFCESRWLSHQLAKEIPKLYPHIKCDYHNAGRIKKQRTQIEQDFREGKLNMVFCTPTLAMGINVPCDICILTAVSRWNPLTNQSEMLGANEIIQKMGRAGRPGMQSKLFKVVNGQKQQYGKAIIFCTPEERSQVEVLIDQPLHIISQIPGNLKYILLTWICAGITTINQLKDLYGRVFVQEVDWELFNTSLTWLREKFFLREDDAGRLSLTHAGEIVAYFAIQPETALHLLRLKKRLQGETGLGYGDIFVLLLATPEFTQNLRTDGETDRAALHLTNQFVHGTRLYDLVGQSKFDAIQLEAVKKAFALVFHEYLSLRYSLDRSKDIPSLRSEPGDLAILQNTIRRIFAAAHALLGGKWEYGYALHQLAKGVDHSPMILDGDIINLTQVEGIGVKTGILLAEAGIPTFQKLQEQNPHHLANRLKTQVVKRNSALKHFTQRMGLAYHPWKAPGEKKVIKIIKQVKQSTKFNNSLRNGLFYQQNSKSDVKIAKLDSFL